jgi:hypothetical protein
VVLGAAESERVVFRVQSLDDWDAVQVQAPSASSVREVKVAALRALHGATDPDAWVVKHKGHEVPDESLAIADAGVRAGSILSVAMRRRRPVR